MRGQYLYVGFCVLMLALSGYGKLRGADLWLWFAGDSTASSGRSSGSGSGGYLGSSSSHK